MITFKEIDKHNYLDVISLKVKEDQKEFIADNAKSLVEAHYEEDHFPLAIYVDDTLVGFVLYDYDKEIPGWIISRYMIDEKYQNKGYGKACLQALLDYLKNDIQLNEVYICVETNNLIAYQMYEKFGFVNTKQIEYTLNGVIYKEYLMKIQL